MPTHQFQLFLIGVAILIAGLLGSLSIYVMADDALSTNAIGYEIIDGNAYAIMAHESKSYRHDLERFGGKAALMADDFNRWFSGLWQGKHLAYTVAIISIGISLIFFRAARRQARDR